MTYDVITLTRTTPDIRAVVESLAATDADLGLTLEADGAVIQLHDADDRPLFTVEVPLMITVPGEVRRLLGDRIAAQISEPLWWIETRASTAVTGADELARQFGAELTRRTGGICWNPEDA